MSARWVHAASSARVDRHSRPHRPQPGRSPPKECKRLHMLLECFARWSLVSGDNWDRSFGTSQFPRPAPGEPSSPRHSGDKTRAVRRLHPARRPPGRLHRAARRAVPPTARARSADYNSRSAGPCPTPRHRRADHRSDEPAFPQRRTAGTEICPRPNETARPIARARATRRRAPSGRVATSRASPPDRRSSGIHTHGRQVRQRWALQTRVRVAGHWQRDTCLIGRPGAPLARDNAANYTLSASSVESDKHTMRLIF